MKSENFLVLLGFITVLSVCKPQPESWAFLLDAAGYVDREIGLKRRGDRVELELPPEALYVVLLSP